MKKLYIKLFLGLFLLIGFQTYANPTQVTGRLVDTKGNPISGAKIELLKSSGAYTFTDQDGNYVLSATVGDTALITSAAHFSKRVSLSESQTIILGTSSIPVDNGLGILKTNENSTASVSSVFAYDLEKSSAYRNSSNALMGELPGVYALEKPGVGDGKIARLNMRGIGTPMILIDGLERDINDINVEEIESISVLKDAASLALYGFRGSNGIILVNTKRGKYKTIEIDFSYDHSINIAQPFISMVNSYDYAHGLNEALAYDGLTPQYNDYQLEAFKNGDQPLVYPNVNWADEVLDPISQSNSYNVQVRGGGEVVRYFSSIGYDTDKGFIGLEAPESSIPNQYLYSNLNVRNNLDISISKSTMLTLNLMGKLKETGSPMLSSRSIMGVLYNTPAAAFPIKTENGEWGASTTWTKNPVADLMEAGFYKYFTRTLLADIALEQDLSIITKGLRAKVKLAYDSRASLYERKTKKYRTEVIIPSFDEFGNPTDLQYNKVGENEGYVFSHWLSNQWQKTTFQGLIDYNKTLGASSVSGGYLMELTSIVNKGIQNTYNRLNHAIFASYDYDNRYLIDASFTLAASNVLNPSRKWGYFPAVSASWLISNENMLKHSRAVDFLKLRASWGLMGDDNIGFDSYKQEYTGGSSVMFGNFVSFPTLNMGALPVQNLTYAKTRSINVGIDATLYKGFDFSIEFFHNRVYDILTNISNVNSSVLGVHPGYANNGETIFKGFELRLGYHKNYNKLKYAVEGQMSFNSSKIINFNEFSWKNDFNKATGQPYGQIFGYEAEGFFKDQADINNSPLHTFSEVQPGDIKYKDQDNNGMIDQYDRIAIGYSSYIPEFYFSLDCNLEYCNLGVNLLFQGVGNYSTILNTPGIYRPLAGNKNISQHYYNNRWTPDNSDAALYPRLTTETNENNSQNSTVWLQDLSYLKLRIAELYYNLPSNWVQKVKLDNARIFVRGYNLFSIDKMLIGDPENTGLGYPLYRTVNMGVKLSF